ncbi:alkaline phosphatase family protein [Emcibacter sp. SYSU 3D8]|uniref:alkaline phosphatase family protein n=1 Tax=Emcibacter sp. SYSU 3D8 TaxID=3133969 RepID=UPI0031FEAA7C
MPEKVLMLGVDGANPDLLLRWSDAGLLPTIQSLRQRGTTCPLEGPPGCGDDGTWATAYTGVSPATHGRYFFRRMRAGNYELPDFGDGDLRHEPFWISLGEAGKRVAIIDVPKSPLPRALNGIYLGDWLVHGRCRSASVSVPEGFAQATVAGFGPAPESLCGFTQPSLDADGYLAMQDRLDIAVRMKRDLCLSVLDREPWDLFLAVFKESHCAGHHGWHLHDANHPLHDPDIAARTGDPLLRSYRAIDDALRAVIDRAGPETTVLVFSVLGMGPNYGLAKLLSEILERLDPTPRPASKRFRGMLKPFARALYRMTGGPARSIVVRTARGVGAHYRASQRCFAIEPSEHVSGIRLNLAGRDPHGLLRPHEVEDYCRQLVSGLRDLVDPESGERVIQDVVPIGDIHQGPHLDDLPDLVVFWNLSRPVSAAVSARVGEVRKQGAPPRTGAHVAGGILFAAGPRIAAAGLSEPRPLVDLAATAGALLGVVLPGCEGNPLPLAPADNAAPAGQKLD